MRFSPLFEALLGGGRSDAARLRGWYRYLLLRRASRRRRVFLVARASIWPYRCIGLVRKALSLYGPTVTDVYGIPRMLQFLHAWAFAAWTGIPPEKYYAFRLFLPERQPGWGFVRSEDMHVLFTELLGQIAKSEAAELDDKEGFRRWCSARGFRTPRTFIVFDGGKELWVDLLPGEELPGLDLFSKPKGSRWGMGAARWIYKAKNRKYHGEEGESLTGAELREVLRIRSYKEPMLLQERIVNHPSIADLSRGGLCTARIVTSRDLCGQVHVIIAAFGMPRGDAPASNFRYSVDSPVDLESGMMGPAIEKGPAHCTEGWSHHPDTGARIAGRVIIYWAEAVDLCVRAHAATATLPSAGWDVAIAPDGPVLIELNVSWGIDTVQMPSGVPIGSSVYARHFISYARNVWVRSEPNDSSTLVFASTVGDSNREFLDRGD